MQVAGGGRDRFLGPSACLDDAGNVVPVQVLPEGFLVLSPLSGCGEQEVGDPARVLLLGKGGSRNAAVMRLRTAGTWGGDWSGRLPGW
jgi:hypothetical protein